MNVVNGVQQIPPGGGGQGPPHQQGHPGGGGGPPGPGQQQQQQQGIPQGLMGGMHGNMTSSQIQVCVALVCLVISLFLLLSTLILPSCSLY